MDFKWEDFFSTILYIWTLSVDLQNLAYPALPKKAYQQTMNEWFKRMFFQI